MESHTKCLLCFSSLDLCKSNRKIDKNVIQFIYSYLIPIKCSTSSLLYSLIRDKRWASILEFLYICTSCKYKVLSVMDLGLDIQTIQTTIKWLLNQIKIQILKSMATSDLKFRNYCITVAQTNVNSYESVTFASKIDCFRSLAVIEYNPYVSIDNPEETRTFLRSNNFTFRNDNFKSYWKTKCKDFPSQREPLTKAGAEELHKREHTKCIVCCTNFCSTDGNENSDVFYILCEELEINFRHPYFNWTRPKSTEGISLFCGSCYSSVATLCDLISQRKQLEQSIEKVILQIKKQILVSMSNKNIKLNFCRTLSSLEHFFSYGVTEQTDYVRRAIIQDLNPEVQLSKLNEPFTSSKLKKKLCKSKKKLFKSKNRKESYPMAVLLKDGECINLNPGLKETNPPLTVVETELYLEFDAEDKKYKCKECGRKLTSKYLADIHVNRLHKYMKMFQCKYCAKQYYWQNDCAYHILFSHKEERKKVETHPDSPSELIKDKLRDYESMPVLQNGDFQIESHRLSDNSVLNELTPTANESEKSMEVNYHSDCVRGSGCYPQYLDLEKQTHGESTEDFREMDDSHLIIPNQFNNGEIIKSEDIILSDDIVQRANANELQDDSKLRTILIGKNKECTFLSESYNTSNNQIESGKNMVDEQEMQEMEFFGNAPPEVIKLSDGKLYQCNAESVGKSGENPIAKSNMTPIDGVIDLGIKETSVLNQCSFKSWFKSNRSLTTFTL